MKLTQINQSVAFAARVEKSEETREICNPVSLLLIKNHDARAVLIAPAAKSSKSRNLDTPHALC
jgi:hypothetical protein